VEHGLQNARTFGRLIALGKEELETLGIETAHTTGRDVGRKGASMSTSPVTSLKGANKGSRRM